MCGHPNCSNHFSWYSPFNEYAHTLVIDGILCGVYVKGVVEGEGLVLAKGKLLPPRDNIGTHLTHVDPLTSQLGADPANNKLSHH